jgi:hypothetical protein
MTLCVCTGHVTSHVLCFFLCFVVLFLFFFFFAQASYQIHSHFRSAGFSQVHAPTITPLDCEGAGELFTLTTPTAGHAHADAIAAATAATAATVVGAAFTPSSSAVPTELRPEDDAAAGPAAAPAPAAAAAASATSFFGVPAHMSVSGQLYGEIAAASVKKVYSFGPTYRAEVGCPSLLFAKRVCCFSSRTHYCFCHSSYCILCFSLT